MNQTPKSPRYKEPFSPDNPTPNFRLPPSRTILNDFKRCAGSIKRLLYFITPKESLHEQLLFEIFEQLSRHPQNLKKWTYIEERGEHIQKLMARATTWELLRNADKPGSLHSSLLKQSTEKSSSTDLLNYHIKELESL